ncbi:uncharacterized protein LOC119077363 isoform X3 [Bradysia coprophila]|uniref:uncharacterized protein LOC119077363 isoform X3 n=1 Tax=Bradysia coprophila TaxID=38358 RepID=UPI00187DA737|nr:uncharacterized protein LOC119077363 isoform X3 [Bradysia coprophila]
MEKAMNHSSSGPKVSQIANLFQRKPVEMDSNEPIKDCQQPTTVVRTESHSTRFNNARALFEKLGVENRVPRPAALSLKMTNSSSKEDILGDSSPDRDNIRTPSPKRTKYPIGNAVTNGVPKRDPSKIQNTSRFKSEKPEKPEKPERKFNSKELIEKQKNWTSHFTKARTTRFNSDPNRCDIIRTVPGTVLYSSNDITSESPPTPRIQASKSVDTPVRPKSPPSPPVRQMVPPEVKPRIIKPLSPTKQPPPIPTNKPYSPVKHYAEPPTKTASPVNKNDEFPENRKRSIDLIEGDNCLVRSPPVEYAQVKKHSVDIVSPAVGVSASSSPVPSTSSAPSSPTHTEDEKQENESTEKSERSDSIPQRRSSKTNSECSEGDRPANSTGRRTNKVSSICLNITDSDSRTPSIISSTDEGGFNEPSPEIKAKLKPAYTFDPNECDESANQSPTAITAQNSLHYVDFGYRLNPDGSESCQVFGESELYQPTVKNGTNDTDEFRKINSKTNGFSVESVVYATIKPEIPPPNELFLECDYQQSENIYHSPQTILDPTRRTLSDDRESTDDDLPTLLPPPRPPLPEGPPLDIQDVEFADASDKEDYLAEDMTADEAERLLSSRILESKIGQQSLLSDEQAREVEELLSAEREKSEKSVSSHIKETSNGKSPADNDPKCPNADLVKGGILDGIEPPHEFSLLSKNNEKNASHGTALNQSVEESMLESILSVESNVTDNSVHSITTTTIDESITSGKIENSCVESVASSRISLAEPEITDPDTYFIPEYPPVSQKEVYVEGGIHYFEDGNFWMEIPGLMDCDEDEDDLDYPVFTKKNNKIRFSTGAIQVFSTYSVHDYDRRNEDVDPVAASAEYELEKRVEKMHVFPVELMKGPEGLGLSIIGMGVGADAGLEKLGIFVKTITDNGAAARDGRIQVNDQIIEVDGKSLVGVTQAYAASVLRNTCGLVKFQIGREKDPDNSEVAQLIRQSLQADRDKEDRLKRQHEEYLRRTLDYSEDSTQPASANSSVSEGPNSPLVLEPIMQSMDSEVSHSQEVESLKRLLQEHKALVKLETEGNEAELLAERLRQTEKELANIKKETLNYQNMLQQSQTQFTVLDRKYNKAKRLVREYQQRELDMVHHEEFYLSLLQEKDTEYNALVKKLKDRVINLEQELQDTQRKAGLPVSLPYDSASLRLTPQMSRRQPPKPLFQKLDTGLSDTEVSDLSPDGEDDKTATVERKLPLPVKDELDSVVPPHELLDSSVLKSKSDLASRGAKRQLPTGKKSLSNSSSDCALNDSEEEGVRTDSSSSKGENGRQNGHALHRNRPDENATPLYAQVHKDRSQDVHHHAAHSTIPNIFKNSNEQNSSYNNDFSSSDSILGSNDKLSDNADSWMYPSRRRGVKVQPNSFTDQLNQVLSDRENRRLGDGSSSRDSSDDFSEVNRSSTAATLSQNLLVEIRQAVNEAQPKVKNILPQSLSPPGTVPWQQQSQQTTGPPSPSSMSSGSTSPGYSPSRVVDLSGSSTSFSSDRRSHNWQNGPVQEWSKEQVCQWLLALGLEAHMPKFIEHGVEGGALLQLDSRDLKILGVTGDDKSKFKRKLKDLKNIIEKEKRQQEKERKEREKLIKKAQKKVEKAAAKLK